MNMQTTRWGVELILGSLGAAILGFLGLTINGSFGGVVGLIAGFIAGAWLANIMTKIEE